MKKKFARAAGIMLSTAMIGALLAGCGNDGQKTAFTVNGEAVPYGEALFLLRTNQAEVYYSMMNSFYGGGTLWDDEFTPEGEEEEVQYGEYFKDTVKDDMVKLVLLGQKAPEYSVAINDADIAKTEELAKEFIDNNDLVAKDMGITYDQVLKVLQLNALKPKMREILSADVDTEVSDEEADMTTISYLRIEIPDEDEDEESETHVHEDGTVHDNDSDEEVTDDHKTKEELYAECEEVLAAYKEAGELDYDSLNEIGDAVDEDFFGMVYSYAPSDAPFSDTVLEAVATLEDGEVYDGIIDDGNYYYMVRLESLHDAEKIANKKDQIVE